MNFPGWINNISPAVDTGETSYFRNHEGSYYDAMSYFWKNMYVPFPPPSTSGRRFSIARYFILRRKPPPANSETAYWFRLRKGRIKQVKCAKLVKSKRSASKPSIRTIMAFDISKKNRQSHDEVKRAYGNQPYEPLLPIHQLGDAIRCD